MNILGVVNFQGDNSYYDTDSDSYSDSDSDEKLLEPLISDDDNDLQMDETIFDTNSNEEDENILEKDNIEYFLMTTYYADIPLVSNVDVGDDLISDLNKVSTKNSGGLAEVIE